MPINTHADKYIEIYDATVLKAVERILHRDVIKTHTVVAVIPFQDKFLVKLAGRLNDLTDDEIKEVYGK